MIYSAPNELQWRPHRLANNLFRCLTVLIIRKIFLSFGCSLSSFFCLDPLQTWRSDYSLVFFYMFLYIQELQLYLPSHLFSSLTTLILLMFNYFFLFYWPFFLLIFPICSHCSCIIWLYNVNGVPPNWQQIETNYYHMLLCGSASVHISWLEIYSFFDRSQYFLHPFLQNCDIVHCSHPLSVQ